MKLLTLTLKPVNKIVTIFFKKKIVTTLVSQNTLNMYKKYNTIINNFSHL